MSKIKDFIGIPLLVIVITVPIHSPDLLKGAKEYYECHIVGVQKGSGRTVGLYNKVQVYNDKNMVYNSRVTSISYR
jgi:hypothetical protein